MQKTVLYPTGPLLDCSKNELTEQFKRALKLVFRRVDRDKDFYLSAEEVRNMQLEIFGHEIDFEGIEMIFKSIQELCFDGVSKKGLNFQGFCAMQIMMIHKLNADACWKILFFFGIGYDFRIHFDLEEVMSKSCNFTKDALVFLVTLFDQFCCEGWLGKNEVLRIFDTCSQTPKNKEIKKIFIEFKDRVEINEEKINLSSWLSYWVLLSHENKAICAEFLLMLAFPKPASDLFLSSPNRTVKSAFITGFNSVGKSWALNTLIKRKTKDYLPTSRLKSVCNTTVQNEIPWLNEFLILTEIPLIEAETTINSLNLSETLIVLTNEDPESQKFSEKMNLKRFPNLLILENQARRLESSFLQSIFQDLPKFISKQVKTEKKVESSWKTLKLAALVLIFSILIGYFLR
jgi:Ca2+-binding EF-hand superfamily protein